MTGFVRHVVADAVADLHAVTGVPAEAGSSPVLKTAAVPPQTVTPQTMASPMLARTVVTPQVLSRAAVTPTVTPTAPVNPIATLVGVLAALVDPLISPSPGVPPTNPVQLLLFNVVRSFEYGFGLVPPTSIPSTGPGGLPVSASPGVPAPGDEAVTPYGDLGKWMLQSNGQIANFGGQTFQGKSLLEPVNVVIIDPTSTTPEESEAKVNAALAAAGFPSQIGHSGGFQGTIDGTTYSQQPSYFLQAYSDNFFLFPGDHARAFGPAPAPDGHGYVYTLAASREVFGFYGLVPTHTYVSYNAARDELATRMAQSGATVVGDVAMNNAYNTSTVTTGDNDGYAVVIRLN